jgi:hypothetical protein
MKTKTEELDFSTPEKDFCCIKMKEVLQNIVYQKIKDMTNEEAVAYFNRHTKKQQ